MLGIAFQQQWLICEWQKIFLLANILSYNYIKLTKQCFVAQQATFSKDFQKRHFTKQTFFKFCFFFSFFCVSGLKLNYANHKQYLSRQLSFKYTSSAALLTIVKLIQVWTALMLLFVFKHYNKNTESFWSLDYKTFKWWISWYLQFEKVKCQYFSSTYKVATVDGCIFVT